MHNPTESSLEKAKINIATMLEQVLLKLRHFADYCMVHLSRGSNNDHLKYIGILSGIRASAWGFIITIIFFFLLNLFFLRTTENKYRHGEIAEFNNVSSEKFSVTCVNLGWADPRIQPWVSDALDTVKPFRRNKYSASEQLRSALSRILQITPNDPSDRLIKEHLKGQISGVPFLILKSKSTSGDQLLTSLERVNPAWNNALRESDFSAEKRAFLVDFSDAVIAEMRKPLRSQRRINGLIQWLTLWLFFATSVLVAQRIFLAKRIQENLLPKIDPEVTIPEDQITYCDEALTELDNFRESLVAKIREGRSIEGKTEIISQELRHLRTDLEQGTYRTLSFLVGNMPALGFIGTVLGMGEALLAADGLLSSSDRQLSIMRITQQLGFAFDTTLVALIVAIIAGVLISHARSRELRGLLDFERKLIEMVKNKGKESQNGQ